MTAAELIAEGERLAKPCLSLRDKGAGAPCAIWGGPGPLPPPGPKHRHWITLDCEAFPEHFPGATGSASLYADYVEAGALLLGPKLSLVRARSTTLLYAHPARSLPPIDAVFRFGSPRVQEWLAAHGWEPTWEYNDNFPDRETARAYERAWQDQCPLYGRGVHAVVGGWHVPWPDGDWEDLLADTLVLMTLEESEPWIEVWRTAAGFRVIQRIT
jgi:hypothetical protein